MQIGQVVDKFIFRDFHLCPFLDIYPTLEGMFMAQHRYQGAFKPREQSDRGPNRFFLEMRDSVHRVDLGKGERGLYKQGKHAD